MSADQAAGLRRRRARLSPRCLHVFFDSADSTEKLVQALHRRGLRTLLIDVQGRVYADAPARSLFDWRQQLARRQLQTLPMSYGEGWHAPGVRADEPLLAGIAQDYDILLFDERMGEVGARMPGAARTAIIEVAAAHESLQRAYALLKTLFHLEETPTLSCWASPPLAIACGPRVRSSSMASSHRPFSAQAMKMMHLLR